MKAQSTVDNVLTKLFPMEGAEIGLVEVEKFFEYLDTDGDSSVTAEDLITLF